MKTLLISVSLIAMLGLGACEKRAPANTPASTAESTTPSASQPSAPAMPSDGASK